MGGAGPVLRDAEARGRIREDLGTTFLVEAAAGTGKTTAMVGRMVGLIAQGECPVESLVAITFTRTAAAELRSRFRAKLEQEIRRKDDPVRLERLRGALAGIDRCFVGTIHAFCGRLLRELPVEANVGIDFAELTQEEDEELLQRAWREYVALQEVAPDESTIQLARLGVPLPKLGQGFVTFTAYPDVAWPVDPTEIPPATVEGHAADLERQLGRMAEAAKVVKAETRAGCFASFCRMLPEIAEGRDLRDLPTLIELLGEFEAEDAYDEGKTLGWPKGFDWQDELNAYHAFARSMAGPFLNLVRMHRYRFVIDAYRGAAGRYEELRREAGALSFADLLQKAADLLENPEVRRHFRTRLTHLLVDEFQDTDPVQARLMLLLSAPDGAVADWRRVRPRPGSLFVVGDPKQSIYRFRRADITTYNDVRSAIQQSGGEVLQLFANFRSEKPVIDFINASFEGKWEPSEAQPAYVSLDCTRETGGDGTLSGVFVLPVDPSLGNRQGIAEAEGDVIARFIRAAVDGGRTIARTADELTNGVPPTATWGDFLLLARQGKMLGVYADALQRYGIPHRVEGGAALSGIAALGHLRSCLRAVANPEDPVALVALLRGSMFGIADPVLWEYRQAGGAFSLVASFPDGMKGEGAGRLRVTMNTLRGYLDWLETMPPLPAIELIAADLGLAPLAGLGADGNLLAGGVGKALRMLRGRSGTLREALDLLDSLIDGGREADPLPALPSRQPVVRIMTIHKAKGLQAAVVFLVDPTGEDKERFAPDHRIDRGEKEPSGCLLVRHGERKGLWGAKKEVVAIPPAWAERLASEEAFVAAEEERLRYVAASRAGAMLVVSGRRDEHPEKSFWSGFPALPMEELVVAAEGPDQPPATEGRKVSPAEIAAEVKVIAGRRGELVRYSRASMSVRALAFAQQIPADGEHSAIGSETDGQQKGRAIHALLEAALRHPGADLAKLAVSVIAEGEFPEVDLDEAVAMVRSVAASDLWRRARASSRCLTEVPFTRLLSSDDPDAKGLPTLLRGVIDLAFLEEGGWVIVDWKSNPISLTDVPEVARVYAGQVNLYKREWEAIAGEKVKEVGLYFTKPGVYHRFG